MQNCQTGILEEETTLARYMTFSSIPGASILSALEALAAIIDCQSVVVGIGETIIKQLGKEIPGARQFSAHSAAGVEIPSTPGAIWCWLRGNDRGELFHRSRRIESVLESAFDLIDLIDAFQYAGNKDLSGYIDGTENPRADKAVEVALVSGQGNGLDGGSFVAVQQWLHDFDALQDFSQREQDNLVGRRITDNEEIASAPISAHVKRGAQESFEPQAFMLRRSMPWAEGMDAGLVFVAFGKSFDAFEAIFNRMIGNEDRIIDGLFSFSRPIATAYYWCPPVKSGRLDISRLRL